VAVDDPLRVRRVLRREMRRARLKMESVDPEGERSLFWITGSTVVFSAMCAVLEEAGRFPVLAVTPSLVDGGRDSALMAIGVSFESNADLAAIYALRILDGQVEPGELDVGLVLPPDVAIDMAKARALRFPIPFSVFETAGAIYDYQGRKVRSEGRNIQGLPEGGDRSAIEDETSICAPEGSEG
jgi:putative ABC transport system substrate-binding protein